MSHKAKRLSKSSWEDSDVNQLHSQSIGLEKMPPAFPKMTNVLSCNNPAAFQRRILGPHHQIPNAVSFTGYLTFLKHLSYLIGIWKVSWTEKF